MKNDCMATNPCCMYTRNSASLRCLCTPCLEPICVSKKDCSLYWGNETDSKDRGQPLSSLVGTVCYYWLHVLTFTALFVLLMSTWCCCIYNTLLWPAVAVAGWNSMLLLLMRTTVHRSIRIVAVNLVLLHGWKGDSTLEKCIHKHDSLQIEPLLWGSSEAL